MKVYLLLLALAPGSSLAADLVLSKEAFLAEFQTKAPAAFCDSKSYFSRCFSVEAIACHDEANKAIAACIAKESSNLPKSFHQPADGQKWGQSLGACAGQSFEESLKDKKRESLECKDSAKWDEAHS